MNSCVRSLWKDGRVYVVGALPEAVLEVTATIIPVGLIEVATDDTVWYPSSVGAVVEEEAAAVAVTTVLVVIDVAIAESRHGVADAAVEDAAVTASFLGSVGAFNVELEVTSVAIWVGTTDVWRAAVGGYIPSECTDVDFGGGVADSLEVLNPKGLGSVVAGAGLNRRLSTPANNHNSGVVWEYEAGVGVGVRVGVSIGIGIGIGIGIAVGIGIGIGIGFALVGLVVLVEQAVPIAKRPARKSGSRLV